ncbi:MAG: carboxypeptidase regulatory-like domain-containing protein [Deltaproteobacteria bacterium]|nr:carboxypeptidase regulatory-like domain-containing protein [Deltaproteobacteria bacterium]
MERHRFINLWSRVFALALVFALIGGTVSFADVTDVKVMMGGAEYTSFPVTLTPDNDGTDDFLNFVFTGSDNDYKLVVDTTGDATAQPIEDWGNTAGKDWTWQGYGPADQPMNIWWEGRDQSWIAVPNGTYQVWIIENQGTWESPVWVEVDSSITVTVSTKYITGTVTDGTDPIEGVRVNAGGPDGWGEAFTDANGDFTISGLKTGTYFMNAEKDGYFYSCNEPGCNDVDLPADPGYATYDVTMQEAVTVELNVALPAAFAANNPGDNLWLNANANNTQGCGWAHGNGEIADGDSTGAIILNMESLEADNTWRVRVTGEYCYWECGEEEGSPCTEYRSSYAGNVTFTLDDVDANDDGTPDTALDVTLTKALSVSGSVTLPAPSEVDWMNINVRLQDVDDPSKEAWGWGNVENGESTGTFYVPAVTAGTYTCYIQTEGYRTSTVEDVVVSTEDVILDSVALDAGLTISGTLYIGGGADGEMNIWLDAWSPSDFNWHGKNITVDDSATSVPFTITGLEDLNYEISCWQWGYEFTIDGIGEDGYKPWERRIAADTTGVNLYLTPYSGSITGTVTWPDGVDFNKVFIAVNYLWGGDGGLIMPVSPAADGSYTIEGLSTGEYLVLINEVNLVGDMPMPTGNVALSSQVVFVANSQATTLNIDLEEPFTVTGTVVDDEAILAGSEVVAVAVPIQLAMGGANIDERSMIMAPVVDNAFELKVGSGTYTITLESEDIAFACEQKTKVVTGDTTVSLEVAEGYTANVSIYFPAALQLADCGGMPCTKWLGGIELFQGKQPVGDWQGVVVGTSEWDDSDIELAAGVSLATMQFENLLDGQYTARFFSEEYIQGSVTFIVDGSDVNATMTLTTGATIKGKVVDAASGSIISSNIIVTAESIPWIDGGYKSTQWNPDGAFDDNGLFYLKNMPAGTYLLSVEYEASSSSTLNYAAASKYGIVITGSSTFDIGTIKLKQGTTISGMVTDINGDPLANIPVEAEAMDSKYGSILLESKTGTDGYYTITGVDPDIPYYEVDAGIRPDPWEAMMMPHCGYGEEVRLNVAPGADDVDFELRATTATLTGTITVPEGSVLAPPMGGEEMSMPVAFIILQRKGLPCDDPMDGIEAMSNPQGEDGSGDPLTSVTYSVNNLVPATYRMMVMSNGLCTYLNESLTIAAGTNELDVTLVEGATVSGTVTKPGGETNPTTSELEMPVAMSANQELVFGSFTYDPSTGEISAYEINGIKPGIVYYVALVSPGEDGPGKIYVQDSTITAADASDSLTLNAVMEEGAPTFMLKALKSGSSVRLEIFSTSHLKDETAAEIISAPEALGTISNLLLSPDKMMISFTYTPAEGETALAFTISAHYGADNTLVEQNFSLNLSANSANQGLVNSIMGGTVNLDGGDASGISMPAGSIDDDGGDGTLVQVTKADLDAGAESEAIAAEEADGTIVICPEATDDLPSWATAVSLQYDFDLNGDSVAEGQSVTVTLQYDEGADTDELNVLHYVDSEWVVEETNKTIDTVNRTISVDVTSVSPFIAAEGTDSEDTPDTDNTLALLAMGGSDGGGCFVDTARSSDNIPLVFLVFLAVIGFMKPLTRLINRKHQ